MFGGQHPTSQEHKIIQETINEIYETLTETITDTSDKAGLADVVLSMLQEKDQKWKKFPDN